MFAKKIYHWNAVDVVRSNGEVHRGLVVDQKESDLLVEFDIAGKNPELVPCQNAYLSNDYTSPGVVNVDNSDDAVVLRKVSKDQPWKWYNGKVLIRPSAVNTFALVKIQLGNEVIVDCVRSDSVRSSVYNGRPMRKNDFVRGKCAVPDGFSYSAQFIALWRKRFPRAHPIGIVDNTFHFIQPYYEKGSNVNKMASALRDGILKEESTTANNRSAERANEKIIYSYKEEADTSYMTEEFSINDLPWDILGIVFSFLDGRQQTRMRSVCPAWHSKLLSPECSREMVVDWSLYQEKNSQYILGAWLFHCITEWTKYVTITRSGNEPAVLSNGTAMSILQKIMAFKNPLSALLLYNMQLESKDILTASRTAISEDMQRVCSRLIFKDVTILNLFNTRQTYHTWTHSSYKNLRIASGAVHVGSPTQLLECFEGAATDFADRKHRDALKGVSQAIAKANVEHGHPENMYRQNQIINALKDWQRNDVRFGPNTEWKHIQRAQLGAHLQTLPNTTLSVFVCLAEGWKREVDIVFDEDDDLGHYFGGGNNDYPLGNEEEDDFYDGMYCQ